ncbi:MAG: hypothetical protein ACQEQG_01065 [Bacillota bacterium]
MVIAAIINIITLTSFIYSYTKSPEKSKKALKIAGMKAVGLAPWMIGIITGIGVLLSLFPPRSDRDLSWRRYANFPVSYGGHGGNYQYVT